MNAMNDLANQKIVVDAASSYGMSGENFLKQLAHSLCARLSRALSPAEILSLVTLISKYDLDPFVGHLYLQEQFCPAGRPSSIRPELKVDGWLHLMNSQSSFDGIEFRYSEESIENPLDATRHAPMWMEATIYRKDRSHATTVREYFLEVYQVTEAWRAMGCRQLRHKTINQAVRVAFGIGGGVFEEGESFRFADGAAVQATPEKEDTLFVPAESQEAEEAPEDHDEDFGDFFADVADVDADVETEADADVETEADADVETEADADVETEADADVETEADADVETDVDADVETEADADVETEADADVETDVDADVETDVDADVETEADADVETDVDADVETEADADADVETEADADADVETEADVLPLSDEDQAAADKIIAEFDRRINSSSDAALRKKAVLLSLRWIKDRAESGKISLPMSDYMKSELKKKHS